MFTRNVLGKASAHMKGFVRGKVAGSARLRLSRRGKTIQREDAEVDDKMPQRFLSSELSG